jgi:hypothetical protein
LAAEVFTVKFGRNKFRRSVCRSQLKIGKITMGRWAVEVSTVKFGRSKLS